MQGVTQRAARGRSQIAALRRRLLAWYDKHRRRLPWRDLDPPDPYATLVSEAMLQQTQVATVIPYYLRFMERFPTLGALAAADIDDVLSYWAGLGYYRRCHHLHSAARRMIEESGGVFPRELEAIRALPGVGRYTAGAIASIAFGIRAAAVDGNVRRVVSRVSDWGDDNQPMKTHDGVWSIAERWVPRRRPGDFNQALMELGATICTPRNPDCLMCPLRRCCAHGHRTGFQPASCGTGLRPVMDRREACPASARPTAKRRRTKTIGLVTVAIEHRGRLLYHRRPNEGLWSGLWEWPTKTIENGASPLELVDQILTPVVRASRSEAAPGRAFHTLVHVLTHRRVRFRAYHVVLKAAPRRRAGDRWLRRGAEAKLAMSRAQVRLLNALPFEF